MKEGRRDGWSEIREMRCLKERVVVSYTKDLYSLLLLSSPSFPPGHFTLSPTFIILSHS